jgi:hypothetical protein
MNRLTVLLDLSGRAMFATAGSPKTVAGAVVIDTSRLESARAEVRDLPKWGRCEVQHAEHVVDFLVSQAVSVGIVSMNRETPAWIDFEKDADVLQDAIVRQSRKVAGWAKGPNLLKFLLLGTGAAVAIGHALKVDPRQRIQNSRGQLIVECSVVCDEEVEGPENLEVFSSLFKQQHVPKSRLAAVGVDMLTRDVQVISEQAEPALFLADYVAGLGLAATLPNPGRLRLPLDREDASRLLARLRPSKKLVVVEEDFAYTHDEIYGHVMQFAREFAER